MQVLNNRDKQQIFQSNYAKMVSYSMYIKALLIIALILILSMAVVEVQWHHFMLVVIVVGWFWCLDAVVVAIGGHYESLYHSYFKYCNSLSDGVLEGDILSDYYPREAQALFIGSFVEKELLQVYLFSLFGAMLLLSIGMV